MKKFILMIALMLPTGLVGAQLDVEDVEIIEWHGAAEECPLFVARKASVVCEGETTCTYDDGEFVAHVTRAKVGRLFRYLVNVPSACLMSHERVR